jgi:hypothetical protein
MVNKFGRSHLNNRLLANLRDFEILLNNEKTLKLSRRYRDDIKKQLQI